MDHIKEDIERDGYAERSCDELPEHQYHARTEWSVSQFKLLPNEPEMFNGRHILRLSEYQLSTSPLMNLGTAIHAAALQDKPLNIIPQDVLASNGAKSGGKWKQFAAEHEGETWLKESEAGPARNALDAIRNNKDANKLLHLDGLSEHSIFWRDEFTGLYLRSRLDRFCKIGNGIVVDLKCTSSATPDCFPAKCYDMKYHIQAATYIYGATQVFGETPEAFVFITVEVEPPYRCIVYRATPNMLDLGYTQMKESLADLKHRLDANNWTSGYCDRINTLDLPKWAYTKEGTVRYVN